MILSNEVEAVDTNGLPSMTVDVRFSLKILLNKTKVVPIFVTNTGASNVTELTVDIESRIFTCISSGGPATTVTWTKDGAVITPSTTHQQTQMIVDTVEGIYQNTLTIAQSVTGDNLYGLYSCMVENSRGSSNRAEFLYGKITYIVSYISLHCFSVKPTNYFKQ